MEPSPDGWSTIVKDVLEVDVDGSTAGTLIDGSLPGLFRFLIIAIVAVEAITIPPINNMFLNKLFFAIYSTPYSVHNSRLKRHGRPDVPAIVNVVCAVSNSKVLSITSSAIFKSSFIGNEAAFSFNV